MNKSKVKVYVFAYAILYASIDSSLYRFRNVISKFQAPTHTKIALCVTRNKNGIKSFITEWKIIEMEWKWIKLK